jgi:hypothetical protein
MTSARLAAVSLALVLVGCGTRTASTTPGPVAPPPRQADPEPARAGRVTVHVKDMTRRLDIG